MMAGGPLLPNEIDSVAKTKHVVSETVVSSRPTIAWQFGDGIVGGVADDPATGRTAISLNATSGLTFRTVGLLEEGIGFTSATDGLTLNSTTPAAVDSSNDLAVPIPASWWVLIVINAIVDAGASASGRFDVYSVNGARYLGGGLAGPGIPPARWAASTVTPISVVFPVLTTAADIVGGAGTFRLMYTVDGGTATLLGNDVEGHAYFHVIPFSSGDQVGGSSGGDTRPDLVVTSVTYSVNGVDQPTLTPGDSVLFSAVLLNQGTGPLVADGLRAVDFKVNGTTIAYGTYTGTLNPGEATTVTAEVAV
jgi:hypothetical protein